MRGDARARATLEGRSPRASSSRAISRSPARVVRSRATTTTTMDGEDADGRARGSGDASASATVRGESINMFRNYENRTAYATAGKRRLPITLLVGFLGGGKTTLARRALENRQSLRVAAAVNDFAALNVDARLVRRSAAATRRDGDGGDDGGSSSAARVTELTNGCLCCTLRDDLERGVVELLNADDDGTDVGLFDYMLIETSGLVDPGEVVARLDKSFGALTRARLDCVVCVVDAEIAADGGPEVERDVWDAQLACADIVLLNKLDLLDGDENKLERAGAHVHAKAPGARVIECVNADVPLTNILDVDVVPQPEGKSGHDWGSGPLPYVLSASGGRLRKPKGDEPKIVTRGPLSLDSSKKTTHLPSQSRGSCNSLSHETSSPLVFARFQHWATKMMPSATIRSKGVVTLAEDGDERESYDFHFSGKSRLEFEPSVGELSSATSTCLVLIGAGLEEDRVMRDVRALEQPLPAAAMRALPTVKRLVAAEMAKDLRFEIEPIDGSDEDALISFRLTGAASNGFTPAELEESHGVDFNALNLELLRSVNASGSGVCLAPTRSRDKMTKFGTSQVFLRMACVSGFEDSFDDPHALARARLDADWFVVRARAERSLERFISHIPQCKCGF